MYCPTFSQFIPPLPQVPGQVLRPAELRGAGLQGRPQLLVAHPRVRTRLVTFGLFPYSYIFLFMPPPFEEWWRGIKCYPCPCVRSCIRPCVRASVRYQNLVSAQLLLKDCIDSIQIWYVDI